MEPAHVACVSDAVLSRREEGRMRNEWGLAAIVALTLIAVPPFARSADESAREAQPSQQSPGVATEGTAATVLHNQEVQSVLGKEVRSIAGEDMGRIVD